MIPKCVSEVSIESPRWISVSIINIDTSSITYPVKMNHTHIFISVLTNIVALLYCEVCLIITDAYDESIVSFSLGCYMLKVYTMGSPQYCLTFNINSLTNHSRHLDCIRTVSMQNGSTQYLNHDRGKYIQDHIIYV